MNKIYKVIWSKARHQYVVASELAKSVTKGAGSRIGRTAAAVLAAIVLTAGAGLPAQAADLTSTSTTYTLDLGLLGSYEINTPITVTTSGENVAASLEGQSLNLGGLTVSGTNVLTEAAMDGVVKWDDETDNSIHGVRFDGNGALSADSLSVAEDRFSVDKYGNIAAQTYGGEGDDTHYYFDMSHADGIQMGYSNGSSMNIDPFGVHFKVGEQETTINGNTIVTGRVNADTVQADNMYVGTQTPGHAVVTQDQLTDGIDTATEGVVKWDTDTEGNYVDGSLRGMHFLGKDGIVTFGNENKVLINGTTGQIMADSMGANSIATKNLSAGNGEVTVDENGKLSTTGEVLMQNGEGESLSMTDGGLNMMTTGDNGTGMLTVANGGISMMGGGNTTVKVDGSGTTFGTRMGDEKTVISGNSITTGSVTGLTNTEWTGKAEDIVENRAATEGQLAALSDDLNASIGTATEGVVKWDEDGNGGYKEGYLTAEHQLSAGNGNLLVDEEGVHLKTPGEILGDAKDETNYYLDMTNEHGIQMGYTGSTSMTITNQGVTFADASGNSTVINGNSIDSGANGSLHTGTVYANNGMYIGDASNPDNAVATKGDLSDAVSTATDGMVKWDKDESGNTTNSINGVGLEDGKITAENGGNIGGVEFGGNGTINAADGNFTVDENGNTGIGGNLDVAGDLTIKDGQGGYINVGDSLTGIKDSIADVNSNISGVKSEVAQNTADISGIKGQIGAVGEDGSLGLTNGADTLVGGINQNASAIQANKDAIGDVSSLKGTDASGNKYTNLTDAVNGNYDAIQVTQTAVQQQGQAINALGGRVHELGEEIDSVGAISSALAGLHPLDYDGTGSKFQLSAAMGTYDGTQAAAIGGFYHFNEDVMLSLGGATAFNGEHKTAANIGVTFRVGPGGSEKKPATPDEVMATLDAMNRKIQEMDAKIAALEQDKKDLTEENQQLKAEAAEAVTAEAPAAEEQA